MAAWQLLPNVSPWVLRTMEEFTGSSGVLPMLVSTEQALVLEHEVQSLLLKEAIEIE